MDRLLLLLLLQAVAPGLTRTEVRQVTFAKMEPSQTDCNCQECKVLSFGNFTLVSKNTTLCDYPSCLYEKTADKTQICLCDAKIDKDWTQDQYVECGEDVPGPGPGPIGPFGKKDLAIVLRECGIEGGEVELEKMLNCKGLMEEVKERLDTDEIPDAELMFEAYEKMSDGDGDGDDALEEESTSFNRTDSNVQMNFFCGCRCNPVCMGRRIINEAAKIRRELERKAREAVRARIEDGKRLARRLEKAAKDRAEAFRKKAEEAKRAFREAQRATREFLRKVAEKAENALIKAKEDLKKAAKEVERRINGAFNGLKDCLANGGPQCFLNLMPTVPPFWPALVYRIGPFAGICTCLSNIGGCYIDAAGPGPGPGFTCTCLKIVNPITGRHIACAGAGYRLGLGEENDGDPYDHEQCKKGARSDNNILGRDINLADFGVTTDCKGYMETFSEQTWEKILKDVHIRLFASNSFVPVQEEGRQDGLCRVWEQGKDIECKLLGSKGDPQIALPDIFFNPRLPLKAFIHGYAVDATFHSSFVPEYVKKYNGQVNIILVDWSSVSGVLNLEKDFLDNNIYMRAARNTQFVGEYLGRCLARLSKENNVRAEDIHVTGHSLGGQMLGKVGPAYKEWMKKLTGSQQKIGRLTGLDPAGPAFVNGEDITADPRLTSQRLDPSAATFVDVIHTNAAKKPVALPLGNPFQMRLGDFGPNGHVDFYPDGGGNQIGCTDRSIARDVSRIVCSHVRAFHYFVDSINSKCEFPVPGEKICMGEPAEETAERRGKYQLESKAWYMKHKTSLMADLLFISKAACRGLSNILRTDWTFCNKDWGKDCDQFSSPGTDWVRLSSYPKGQVELFKNGQWGTLCGHYWWNNQKGAENICKALGYEGGTRYTAPGGSGPILAGNRECKGGEATVWDCPLIRLDTTGCTHDIDQGVSCT